MPFDVDTVPPEMPETPDTFTPPLDSDGNGDPELEIPAVFAEIRFVGSGSPGNEEVALVTTTGYDAVLFFASTPAGSVEIVCRRSSTPRTGSKENAVTVDTISLITYA